MRFSHLWRSTSCAIAGRGAFYLFTPPPRSAARAMQPTIMAERSHLSCGTQPRAPLNDVSQRGHLGANVPRMARRSPKPLGWVRFPTVPAIFLGVAQLAERVAWDHEAVRAGLTTQTIWACNSIAEYTPFKRTTTEHNRPGLPSNDKRKLESFLKIIYNIYIKLRKE